MTTKYAEYARRYRDKHVRVACEWVQRDGHRYRPDTDQPVDPIAGCRPCQWCGRFKGSALHPEPAPAGGEEPDHA